MSAQVESAAPGESYGLSWPGKRAAIRAAYTPPTGVLLPLPGESVGGEAAENLVIEGENLEALKLLQSGYRGRIGLIYIDPPYNTGSELIYPDDFRDSRRDYLRATRQTSERPMRRRAGLEASGRLHARWLSLMYPRLLLARRLLRRSGFIAVSIGEEEVAHLRLLLDEIFGPENHRNTLAVRRHDKNLSRQFMTRGLTSLAVGFEYVLIYARSPAAMMNPVFRPASRKRQTRGYWKGFWNAADRPTMRYPLFGFTPAEGQWKWKEATAREAVENYQEYLRHHASQQTLEEYWEATGRNRRFIRHNPAGRGRNQGIEHWVPPSAGILRTSDWTDQLASESLGALGIPFTSPKHRGLLKHLLQMLSREGDVVLDFFAGSGTTAHAVLELNLEDGSKRRFILVQYPEPLDDPPFPTIAHLTRERVRRALAACAAGEGAAGSVGFRALVVSDGAREALTPAALVPRSTPPRPPANEGAGG